MKKLEQIVSDGIDAYEQGNFSLAYDLNQKAIKYGRLKNVDNKTKELLHSNFGFTLLASKSFERAKEQFALANHYKPNDENGWSQFICLASQGNWKEALKFHHHRYGKTRTAPTKVSFPDLPIPMAKSLKDLQRKRVLVLNEQGLGDEILFFSAIRKLASQMTEVHLQCYPETLRLFQANCPDNVTFFIVRTLERSYIESFDVYTCTGDLFAFSTQETLNYTHFLTVPRQEKKGIGYCWKANVLSPNAKLRSSTPEMLAACAKAWERNPELNFSLQMNDKEDCPDWMTPFPEDIKDFYDTAVLVSGLQEVITVDTSIAHLCGSMHIPTTLVINKHRDWRFRLVNEDNRSLFYPSIKVIQL